MRLAIHIFRKDLERLWPVVLVTFALLGLFVYYDANHPPYVWRATFPQGTWLNLVLPFAWCFLTALAILEDPLVGDKQLWVALPGNWRTLLLAKVTFVVATIAAPYLLATAMILIARGFNPFQYIPHLLWKQLLLFALIVPAAALATLAKNIGQFLLAEITVLSATMFLGGLTSQGGQAFRSFPWDVRWDLAVLLLAIGGLLVTMTQFVARRTVFSRILAVLTVAGAFALYNYMSRDASAAVRVQLSGPPKTQSAFGIRLASADDLEREGRFFTRNWTVAVIPVMLSGPLTALTRFEEISLTLTTAGGARYEAQWPQSTEEVRAQRITEFLQNRRPDGLAWLYLQFANDKVLKALLKGPVVVSGRLLVQSIQPGTLTSLPISSPTNAAGIGHCSLNLQEDPMRSSPPELLITECESPDLSATNIGIGNRGFLAGRLPLRDENSLTPTFLPMAPWLSPLYRSVQIASNGPSEADAWRTIAPLHSQGIALVDFTIPNLNLADYIVHDPRAGAAK